MDTNSTPTKSSAQKTKEKINLSATTTSATATTTLNQISTGTPLQNLPIELQNDQKRRR